MKKLLLSFLSFSVISSSTVSVVACGQNNTEIKEGEVSFYMLSIGNGLFTFLKYDTNKAIVFDAGVGGNPQNWYQDTYKKNPFPSEFMKKQGVEEIEAVFLTHDHTDHYANLWQVDKEFQINNLVLPYDYKGLLDDININKIVEDNTEMNIIKEYKSEYSFGGIIFNNWTYYIQDYLSKVSSSDQNNKSTILQFTINGVSFLITGDAESKEGTEILKKVDVTPIDVYQVPHHGSANSAGTNFLKKVQPKYCYISGASGDSSEIKWSKFDGGHAFPTASAINNLSNYCDKELNLTGSPYNDNTYDLDNYNYTYEFKINADKTTQTIKHDETILDTL